MGKAGHFDMMLEERGEGFSGDKARCPTGELPAQTCAFTVITHCKVVFSDGPPTTLS